MGSEKTGGPAASQHMGKSELVEISRQVLWLLYYSLYSLKMVCPHPPSEKKIKT